MYSALALPFFMPWIVWLTWINSLNPVKQNELAPEKTWKLPEYRPDFDIPHYYLSSEEILARYKSGELPR